MSNSIHKAARRYGYAVLSTIGAAAGSGSRSRTFRSAKEKFADPKRQRKQQDWRREW